MLITSQPAQGPYEIAPAAPAGRTDSISLVERLWAAINAHRTAIGIVVVAFLVLGVAVTLLQTPKYTASARIQIVPEQDKVTNVQSLEADASTDSLEFYQTQYSLLGARSLAERVARQLRLASNEEFLIENGANLDDSGAMLGGGADRPRSAASAQRNRRLEQATDILLRNVSITPIRRSSLIDVSYTSTNAVFSAEVANAWVDQFQQQALDRRFGATADARDFLEGRLAQLRERLEKSEKDLVTYASSRQIVPLETTQDQNGRTVGQRTLVSASLEKLNEELLAAQAARVLAQSQAGGAIAGDGPSRATLATLRQSRAVIAADRARLLAQFEEGYPEVESLTSQLAEIDRAIAREEQRGRADSSEVFQEAVKREQALRQQVAELEGGYQSQRRDSIQYQIFQREVDTNRQLYEALLQRYKEIGVAGVSANNITVIDTAEPPRVQSSPKTALNILISLILGTLFAGLYVLIREQVDQSIKDPKQVTSLLGLPLLGAVPASDPDQVNEEIMDTKSETYEAYAAAATNLMFLTPHGIPRSILLTSTQPNEAKSTSAMALAYRMASLNRRVLLLDGDIRNPTLAKLLDQPAQRGLTHFLTGDDDIDGMVVDTDKPTLSFMGAGIIPPNPIELLSSPRFPELIRKLEGKFDNVVIDGPPILGLADAPLIGAAAEGVVICIRANVSKVRAISSALDRLRFTGSHLFGAIVTVLDRRSSAYGYGYGLGYGYGYGSRDGAEAQQPS